jgi:AraC-like DNA-binding protein
VRHILIPSLSRVHADNGGLGIFNAGWTHPRRRLTSSVLLLGVRGTVRLSVEDEPLDLVPGRVVVLPVGLIHQGVAPVVESASYYWLHFTFPGEVSLLSQEESDTILSSEGVASHRLEDAAFLPMGFDLPEPEPYREEFREVLNQQENPTYTGWMFQLLFQGLLIHLTEAVIRAHQPPQVPSSSSSVVYGVLSCVAENLTDPNLSIKTVAQSVGLNLDYTGRRFKEVMGVSVGDYILKERLKVALVRLHQTQETLASVASACGFGTLRHFLRQFKAQFGTTPTEARTRYRRMHFNSL